MKFLVIDTETTWSDRVMSIGVVLSDEDMWPLESAYYVLAPEYMEGGLYSHALAHERAKDPIVCTRREAMQDILNMCLKHNVTRIFAYNALFDKSHLPELSCLEWYDIMRLAAYIQYNPCWGYFGRTGRISKRTMPFWTPLTNWKSCADLGIRLKPTLNCNLAVAVRKQQPIEETKKITARDVRQKSGALGDGHQVKLAVFSPFISMCYPNS